MIDVRCLLNRFRPFDLFLRGTRPRRRTHGLGASQSLEDRTLMTIDIVFDYTYDTTGFFNVPGRKAALEMAGQLFEDAFTDDLAAIVPSGGNDWWAIIDHPATGNTIEIANPTIPANQILIYVGARDLGGNQRGEARTGNRISAPSNTFDAWRNAVRLRGETGANEVGPWGGSVTFDVDTNWHSDIDTNGLSFNESDLYSVAIHEIAHILGFSSGSTSWNDQISGGLFNGPNAQAANNGQGVPVSGGHLQDNLQSDGQEVSMSPVGTSGQRNGYTRIDWAVTDDLGWSLRFNENAGVGIGQLVIQVQDASGTPLSNQQVTISGGGTILDSTGTTDANGLFSTFVTRGNYNVTVGGAVTPVTVDGPVTGVEIPLNPVSAGEGILVFEDSTLSWKVGKNTGGGFSWTQTGSLPTNTNGWKSFIGDFNGDQLLDGVVLNLDNLRFNFYRNTGNGTLANPVPAGGLSTSVSWDHFQVGDYNGDGTDEILAQIVAGTGTGAIRTQGVNGVSSFYVTLATGYETLLTGDFNGDGSDDLVGLYDNAGQTQTSLIQAISIHTPVGRRMTSVLGTGVIGQSVATGGLHNFLVDDFNGDGRADLVVLNGNGQAFNATTTGDIRNNAPNVHNFVVSNRAPAYTPALYTHPVLAGNFTSDNRVDLFGARSDNNGFWVAISTLNSNSGDNIPNGSLEQNQTSFGAGVASNNYVVGDFDNDGIDDVAAINGIAFVYLSTGTTFGTARNFGAVQGGGLAANLGAIETGAV
ncbi:MAG: VCBS repeat-containing protein [Planctomycetaceae bacterium]|nr:VCBS repeat-containing protein [Planctomycetaceae bacterium]